MRSVVELVDRQLAMIFASSPLRTDDLSSLLSCDANQVAAVFDLLAGLGLLRSEAMVECGGCFNLMRAADFRQAAEDEDVFECSSCGAVIRVNSKQLLIYRMTDDTLARPRPVVDSNEDLATFGALTSAENIFKRHGQIWILKYRGEIALMQDSRGLEYLARLLAEPHREIPAVLISAAVTGIDPRVSTGSSGTMLDEETRERYHDLQAELDEAKENNELGRIESLQRDINAMANEIAKATGLGGRLREKTDVDKVRKAVSGAIDRAIKEIADHHESLGRHLMNTIRSGTTFSYTPECQIDWLT